MVAPLQVAWTWNWSPQRFRISTLQSWQSTPWRRVASIGSTAVGEETDEILWIVHGKLGNFDAEFFDPTLRICAGVRIRVPNHPDTQFESVWVCGPEVTHPILAGTYPDCGQPFCFIVRAPNTRWDPPVSMAIEARVGVYGQARECWAEVENLTATAINLDRLTARGVDWFYDENWNAFSTTVTPQTIHSNVAIPNIGQDVDWLVLGCGRVTPGWTRDHYELDLRHWDGLSYSTRVGPAGLRAYALTSDNTGSFHRQFVGLPMAVRAGANGGESVGLFGKYRYALEPGNRAMSAGRSIFGLNVSALRGVIEGRDSETFGGGPEWNAYGPFLRRPGNVQTTESVQQYATQLPQTRIGLAWLLPRNRHSPSIPNAFAGRVVIQDAQLSSSSRANPLFTLHPREGEGLPDYETEQQKTGRGGYRRRFQGWLNPALDPLDANGNPTRITNPRYPFTAQGVLCSFAAVESAFDNPVGTTAKGPALYLVPGRESPDPSALPPWFYEPENVLDLQETDLREGITTADGRLIQWGTSIQPRRTARLEWTFHEGQHGIEARSLSAFSNWLRALERPIVQWDPDESGAPGAWLVTGEPAVADLGATITRLSLEVVELIWTEAS